MANTAWAFAGSYVLVAEPLLDAIAAQALRRSSDQSVEEGSGHENVHPAILAFWLASRPWCSWQLFSKCLCDGFSFDVAVFC